MAAHHIVHPVPEDVLGFIGELRGNKYSPYTLCLYLTVLRMYFSFLHSHNENGSKVHIYPNICDIAQIKLKRPKKEHTRDRLTSAEIKKLK